MAIFTIKTYHIGLNANYETKLLREEYMIKEKLTMKLPNTKILRHNVLELENKLRDTLIAQILP